MKHYTVEQLNRLHKIALTLYFLFFVIFLSSCKVKKITYLDIYEKTQSKKKKMYIEGVFILRKIINEDVAIVFMFENIFDHKTYKIVETDLKKEPLYKIDKFYKLEMVSLFVRSYKGVSIPNPRNNSYNRSIIVNDKSFFVEDDYKTFDQDLFKILKIGMIEPAEVGIENG